VLGLRNMVKGNRNILYSAVQVSGHSVFVITSSTKRISVIDASIRPAEFTETKIRRVEVTLCQVGCLAGSGFCGGDERL
jgi:hypothetical protein